MRTANPALNDAAFRQAVFEAGRTNVMTVNGAVIKTGVLVGLLLVAAAASWHFVFPDGVGPGMTVNREYAVPFLLGGLLIGAVSGLVLAFVPKLAPTLAPVYAVGEGLFLGAASGLFAAQYAGIVLQAVLLTVGVLAVMLLAYLSGVVRATEGFKMGVIAATGAVALVYLATILLGFFGVQIPYIHSAGPIGIGFSVVVVVIAALNLVLDFDVVESGARAGAPKYMEWYAGYGLLVTLVWLYLEILRLLLKIRNSD
jgi:uncharacterized YccA/Bax inhibitor family protein